MPSRMQYTRRSSWRRRWEKTAKMFVFHLRLFWLNSGGKSGSTKRGEGGRQQRLTGLTLHPLFPLAFLSVLLLEFGYQARVHVPGLRNGTLLVLLYTGEQNQTERLLRNCPGRGPSGLAGWVRHRALSHTLLEACQASSRVLAPLGPERSHYHPSKITICGSSIGSYLV